MNLLKLTLIGVGLLLTGSICADPIPRDFEVTNNGHSPDLVAGDSGFVVVWRVTGGIFGRQFDSLGNSLSAELPLRLDPDATLRLPKVALGPAGDFLVVWDDGLDVVGQRFEASGVTQGDELILNDTPGNFEDVTGSKSGRFLVVWEHFNYENLLGQVVDGDGMKVGGEFLAGIRSGEVEPWSDGFAVAWRDEVWEYSFITMRTSDGQEIFTRTLNTSVGAVVPSVASRADDQFLVVWYSIEQENPGFFGRLFASDGSWLGSQLDVSLEASGRPDVTALADGSFFVTWADGFGAGSGIQGLRLDSTGSPIASQFQVSSATTSSQITPKIATSGDSVVVIWQNSEGIQGRLYPPEAVFADGFEAGNTSAWTVSVD